VLVLLISSSGAYGQTTPRIEYLFPPGAQRGTQTQVQIVGEFMPGRCGLSVAGDGFSSDTATVGDQFNATLASDAPAGSVEVRIFAPQGASAPFPFIVGELPEIVRGDAPIEEVSFPVTVNGRLEKSRSLHAFDLNLAVDQQIVCAAQTKAFRSSVTPTMRVLDTAGRIVADSFDHPTADALLVFRAPAEGVYRLEMYDFQLGGGPKHIYRLTLTDGPWIASAFPPQAPKKARTELTLFGWNLPGGDGQTTKHAVQTGAKDSHQVRLPQGANVLDLPLLDAPAVSEKEPNNQFDQANDLTLPALVHGRLQALGDTDVFALTAAKGDAWTIKTSSAGLDFPADLVLDVLNEKSVLIKSIDDTGSPDPTYVFTAPADGRYFLSLRDVAGRGGEEFVYSMHIGKASPSISAQVVTASLILQAGETATLPVTVTRSGGFDAEVELAIIDPPSGVTVEPVEVPQKPSNKLQLSLTAAAGSATHGALVQVVLRDKKTGEQLALARVKESAKATTTSDHLWVAIGPKVPFSLSTTTTILEAPRLAAFPFPVTVTREEGFTGAIQLIGVEPDKRGTVIPLTGVIPAGSAQGSIPLVIQRMPTEGTTHRCRVMGVAEVAGGDGKPVPVFFVGKGNMSMGCAPGKLTLGVQPSVVRWSPDEPIDLQVDLMRRVSLGEVTIALKDPPAGVVCEGATVASQQSRATLTLQVDAAAKLPPRIEIVVRAETVDGELPVYAETTFRLEAANVFK